MTATISTNPVPQHLVGTRAGLFRLLRGTQIGPDEDVTSQGFQGYADSASYLLSRHQLTRQAQLNDWSLSDKIDKLINDDEFCFLR